MGRIIGIDLGTTNSCASVVIDGKAEVIPSSEGKRTTPSIVAFTEYGDLLVGEPAERQSVMNPKRTFSSIKRKMGTDWKADIDGKKYVPQEISAMILRKIKKDAEAYLGEPVEEAVITVPAYFNDTQRQATKDAGVIAGLSVRRIINEPTSAALAFGLDHGSPQKVMVYDLGGGTFDVSIIEIGDGIIEVLSTSGDNHLGGDDFDAEIVSWIVSEFKRKEKIDLSKNVSTMQRVKEAAEQAKKDLSSCENATISLPFICEYDREIRHLEMTLSRTKFDELTRALVERTAIPVEKALNDANLAKSELNKVLLVGGSTRIPAVRKKVRELTGIAPSLDLNPDECVAIGAAIQGDTLSGHHLAKVGGGSDLLLLDVTSLSLSIETIGGVATRLIERNTTLPAHYSRVFSTAQNYQSSVDIRVLQGERPMAQDNKTIGTFKLKGIRKAPAGVPKIEVTFDIDANGILIVSAKDLDTGKAQSITIASNEKMSSEEIQRAIEDAKRFEKTDKIREKYLEVRSRARQTVDETEADLKKNRKTTDKKKRKEIEKACQKIDRLLNKVKPINVTKSDLEELETSLASLNTMKDEIKR